MKVLKFGGKTIATPEGFKRVAEIAGGARTAKTIVVIPAIPAITRLLEDISEYFYKKNHEGANEVIVKLQKETARLTGELFTSEKSKQEAAKYVEEITGYIRSFSNDLFTLFEKRIVMAQGELLSSFLFFLLLNEQNVPSVKQLPALDFMKIDKNYEPDTAFIREELNNLIAANEAAIYITEGYICRNAYGEIDDLRNGGNDYTASLIGAAVKAEEIQIWTHTSGIHNVDAEIVSGSKTIKNLSFDEAAELAYFGDKILHPSSILPAKLANIPVRILSVQDTASAGTLISEHAETGKIKAVASKENITAITVKSGKMLLAHGFLRKIAEVFELHQTSIDMLASSEVGISLTIDNDRKLELIVDDLRKYGTVSVDKDMVIICIVGDLGKDNNDARSNILGTIRQLPVNMISYGGSEYNFSFLVKKRDHLETIKTLNDNLF